MMRQIPWGPMLAVLAVIVLTSLLADAIKGDVLFEGWSKRWAMSGPYRVGVVFVLFFLWMVLAAFLYNKRAAWTHVRALSRQPSRAHRSVILLVSPQRPQAVNPEWESQAVFPLVFSEADKSVTIAGKDLKEDISALDPFRWNWQQLLRAVAPHVESVERIHLVGSGGEGSFQELGICEAILRQYLPRAKFTRTEVKDFEDFAGFIESVGRIMEAEVKGGLKETDVIVDVTGGQKTASIAAAMVTLDKRVRFQYVQTTSPYEVYTYDVVHQSPPSSLG